MAAFAGLLIATDGLSLLLDAIDPGNLRYLNGTMAKVHAYSRPLSASEITANFNAHRGLYGL